MMSVGFLHLQALFFVAMTESSFGIGGEICFGEGKDWADWFGMDAGSKRFVAKGHGGMCLAMYDGPGVDFQSAANACNVSFVGGRLLSNESWGAFVTARDNSKVLMEFNKTIYVGFLPQPGLGCFVIGEYPKATLEDPCRMERRSFVCEYPRQEFCRWETMNGETPVRRPNGQWEITEEVVQLQKADVSEQSWCETTIQGRLISARLAACRPLFKNTWSQWSECGSCINGHLQGNQLRSQAVTDRCVRLAGNVSRYHTRSCFHMPCPTDAITEEGVSVISISHLPMLFVVFFSMFSY